MFPPAIEQLSNKVYELHHAGAIHVNRGYRLSESTPAFAAFHAMQEMAELYEEVQFGHLNPICDVGLRERKIEEAGDALACLFHWILLEDNISLDGIAARAIEKLNERFTTDPSKVKAKFRTFTRTGRVE